ncbi:TlpA disulfide reductase family protein [Leeuwenhoekiella marinoflava]|uniref:TlpA family protein disulfide reductase n=1 Tax=Leeuwenhoekiella marinoflava TaxID=988 RepID=UPI003001C5BC
MIHNLKFGIIKVMLLIVALFAFSKPSLAQEDSKAFTVTPNRPKGGDQIKITYNSTETPLKNQDSLTGIFYTYADYKWIIEDVSLTKIADNKWETKVQLNPKAALINFTFNSKDDTDLGGLPTYSWIINEAPGSYSGWGLMRNPSFNQEFPQKLDSISFIEDKVSLMWINNEIRNNPSSRAHVFFEGLSLKMKTTEADQTSRIKEELRYILDLPLDVVQQYDVQRSLGLLDQTNNKSFIDSVETVLLFKYPKGVLARDKEIKKLYMTSDANERIDGFKAFQQKFPQEKFSKVNTVIGDLYYDKLYKAVAYTYIVSKKDYGFVFDNLKTAPFSVVIDYGWHLVSIPNNNESMSLDSLNLFAGRIIPEMERREQNVPNKFVHMYSPKQWKERALKQSYREYLTYAKILEKVGGYQKEAHYLEKVKPFLAYNDTDFNELYALQLKREGNHQQAVDFILECLKLNNTSAAMLSILKEDFIKKGGKETDFESYVTGLKSTDSFDKHRSELISELMNEPIEGFDLESSYGGSVKLADQKGKIVIIDMWATWCAPCKKAMPGMKMAVDKYAEDANVKFYFLDTQEYIKDYKAQTAAFIKEKGYPFEILYDAENSETGKLDDTYAKYAKAFEFSGIPQKMIIDQKGNLRWRSTGYMGSPSELADEISIIIEFLKAETKS